jgi:ankyrin repeat protein
MIAILSKRTDLAKLLIEKGASINATGVNGITPLHCAAYMGNAEITELLLKKGADRTVKNSQGLTPLETAQKNNHPKVAGLLSE